MDSVRDLLRVRECAAVGSCKHLEISAHAGQLMHGSLWMRFLIVTSRLGITVSGLGVLLVASFAMAAALTFWWVARMFSTLLAPLAAIGFLFFIPLDIVLLTNTSLAVLPAAVFHIALSHIAGRNTRRWIVIGGLALFCCVEANASCLVMLPIYIAVSTVSAGRPLPAFASAVASLALPALLLSRTAWANNLSADGGMGVPVLGATILLVGLALCFRPTWLRIPALQRQQIVVIACVAAFAAAVWVMVEYFGWQFVNRYMAIVLPAVAALPAVVFSMGSNALSCWSRRFTANLRTWGKTRLDAAPRIRWALVLGLALLLRMAAWGIALPFVDRVGHPPINIASFKEAEILAEFLTTRGWSYYEVQQALHGPHVHGPLGLLVGLSLYMEPQTQPPPMTSATHLRILRIDKSQVRSIQGPGWDSTDLSGNRVALISAVPAWVRARPAKVFVDGRPWPEPGEASGSVSGTMELPLPNQIFEVGQLAGIDVPPNPSSVWVDLPIDTAGETGERVVNMLDATWLIADVEGIAHDPISADGKSVLLRSAAGAHHGMIRFAFRSESGSWLSAIEFIETFASETGVRAFLDGQVPGS